jgi:methionyl-tRNA formyltransferase
MKLGLLLGGKLGARMVSFLENYGEIEFIMTDSNSSQVINFSKNRGIPLFCGNPRTEEAEEFFSEMNIDILISVNYLFIIQEKLIDLPKKIAFNVHGALLPKYRGRTPHVWAIINNEKNTGVTAHVMEKGCDTGDIIEQVCVPIHERDTGATLLDKFDNLYYEVISTVISKIKLNNLVLTPQDHTKATFFTKRTPEDGLINWNWQKERIRNWVRAQSYPYPGAFTFVREKKLIIDEVCYADDGYDSRLPNGTVLNADRFIVKTNNGAIKIKSARGKKISLEENMVLNSTNFSQ